MIDLYINTWGAHGARVNYFRPGSLTTPKFTELLQQPKRLPQFLPRGLLSKFVSYSPTDSDVGNHTRAPILLSFC